MFARLRTWWKQKDSRAQYRLYGLDNLDDDAIGYPPNPQGIPVVQPKVLLSRLEPEIQFIRSEMGLSTEEFNHYVLPVMEKLITYADLLPASEYMHHSTGGGLIAHSFDVAKRAMRSAQHAQFPIGSGYLSDTQLSNMQWKTATVLSALLHDSGKVLADMEVSNGAGDNDVIIWDSHSADSIHDWAAKNNIERYFIRWRERRHQKHQNASLMVMQRLIPQQTWSWIDSCYDGKYIHAAMLAAIANADLSHPMSKIVAESDSSSCRDDMLTRNSHITKEVKRVPLSQILADLMKHYILTNKWAVNCKDAPVWFVEDELFVVWATAIPDLLEDMNTMGYMIPKVPEVLARTMIEEGMAVANGEEPLFVIYPEILGQAKSPVGLSVLKIRNVERLVIEQHKLYSIREHESKRKVASLIEVPPEEADIPELPSNVTKKTQFESSMDTMARVLNNMKNAGGSDLPEDSSDEDVRDSEPHKHDTNVQTEQPTEPPVLTFQCPAANYIQAKFHFDIQDGAVIVPREKFKDVVHSMSEANWTIASATKAISASSEVMVHE